VRRCLESLINTPADILAVDNAADVDVKEMLRTFGDRIKIEVSPTNEFCNGGWNRVMKYGLEHNYDVIGLGSSDAMLHPGWYHAVCGRFREYADEILVPSVREPFANPDYHKVTYITGGLAGYYMFMTAAAVAKVYPIPAQFKHWYGDQHIFDTLRYHGWKVAVLDEVGAYHEQGSVTFRTPEAYEAIRQDTAAWSNTNDSEKSLDNRHYRPGRIIPS